MKSTLRYWLSLLFLGAVSCVCTLLLVQRDPTEPAPRDGGYTNAQVAASIERAMAGCHLLSTEQTRDGVEAALLAICSEHRVPPMAVLARMRCDAGSEGVEGFRRAANRAASDLAAER
jgi:hypothetical protein